MTASVEDGPAYDWLDLAGRSGCVAVCTARNRDITIQTTSKLGSKLANLGIKQV